MFKEDISEKFNTISPSPELLEKVSLMMKNETEKPKSPIYFSALKYGGMAAAVCLITAAAIITANIGNKEIPAAAPETAAAVIQPTPEGRAMFFTSDDNDSAVVLAEEIDETFSIPYQPVNASITFSYRDGTMLSPDSEKTTETYEEVQNILFRYADDINEDNDAEKPVESDFIVTLFCPDGMYVNDNPIYNITIYCSKNGGCLIAEGDINFNLLIDYSDISFLYELY